MNKVYISGALTGIDNSEKTKAFYESLGTLCEEIGLIAYIPHLATDPITHAHVSPQQVYETDRTKVCEADIVIAYLGHPSFGVGMELAYADVKAIPIILLYEDGKQISRFPRGIPSVLAEIKFLDSEDAFTQLKPILKQWMADS